ncbi:MAG: Glycogen synthase [Chloroflexi bacterium ADurb.Bin325]|nr:MAG: Glycogen synthase [Chloroflexi bacterium ADurb.Bin325]
MRIAFTVHKFPPESLGGTEIYTWSAARALAAQGHEVSVFYPLAEVAAAERRVRRDGVQLWRAPLPAGRPRENPAAQYWHTFRDAAIEADFAAFLAEARPDVIHYQHVQGVSARLIALGQGRPRIVTLHDYWYFCANSQLIRPDRRVCDGPRFGWNCVDCATARADLAPLRIARPLLALPFAYRNVYLRRLAAQVDLFLAPSEFLRGQYIRQGFPADRIRVLENGIDRARLDAPPAAPLPEPPARPHFGFLGSLAWQKGVHVLIEAFNQLPPAVALTIYGSDRTFPEYAAELKALARHPHIRFAGALDYRSVGAALRQLDALVVPSVWYENSPLVIQEAYAAGAPVIASRLGALTEKVQEGVTGYLFEPGDSADLARVLKRLSAEPERLAVLRPNLRPGPDMVEHAAALAALYAELIVSPGPPPETLASPPSPLS